MIGIIRFKIVYIFQPHFQFKKYICSRIFINLKWSYFSVKIRSFLNKNLEFRNSFTENNFFRPRHLLELIGIVVSLNI